VQPGTRDGRQHPHHLHHRPHAVQSFKLLNNGFNVHSIVAHVLTLFSSR
jgi:hypothetical protein